MALSDNTITRKERTTVKMGLRARLYDKQKSLQIVRASMPLLNAMQFAYSDEAKAVFDFVERRFKDIGEGDAFKALYKTDLVW